MDTASLVLAGVTLWGLMRSRVPSAPTGLTTSDLGAHVRAVYGQQVAQGVHNPALTTLGLVVSAIGAGKLALQSGQIVSKALVALKKVSESGDEEVAKNIVTRIGTDPEKIAGQIEDVLKFLSPDQVAAMTPLDAEAAAMLGAEAPTIDEMAAAFPTIPLEDLQTIDAQFSTLSSQFEAQFPGGVNSFESGLVGAETAPVTEGAPGGEIIAGAGESVPGEVGGLSSSVALEAAQGLAVVGAAADIAFTIAGNAPDWEKAVVSALDVATVTLLMIPGLQVFAIITGAVRMLVGLFGGDSGPSKAWLSFGARVGETITLEVAAARQLVQDLARTMFEDEVAAVVAKFNATMALRIGHDSPAWADVHGPYDLVHLVGAGGSKHEGGIVYDPDPINEQLKKAVPFALQRVADAKHGVPGAVGQMAAIWQQRYRTVSTPLYVFQPLPLSQLQGPIGLVLLNPAEPWWRVTPLTTDARPDERIVLEMPVLAEFLWQLYYTQIAKLFGFADWGHFLDWDLAAEWTAYRAQNPSGSATIASVEHFAHTLKYDSFEALRDAAFHGLVGAITQEGTMIDLTAVFAALQELHVAVSALQGRASADEAALTNALNRIGFVESYAVSATGPPPGTPFYQASQVGGA